ncbi:hypothetical protein VW23_001040 [Devosia insulae DS-56]|uniref:Toprim domain-containing protein n=2 Tax=Devosia insulae TaxID=408174 RepID=A0A1E5XSY9_9HYPH|nr:hypothetical protein VW23_001040 [Devosia insulae DS-56]
MADADRGPEGELRHRFIGLFDNDRAGRRALARACEFDRRLVPYQDVFLLQPVMPVALVQGVARLRADGIALNKGLEALDWEIEDLLSQRLLANFEQRFPDCVLDTHNVRGKYHREFTRQGKVELRKYALAHATVADVDDILRLVKALRSYFGLLHSDISI